MAHATGDQMIERFTAPNIAWVRGCNQLAAQVLVEPRAENDGARSCLCPGCHTWFRVNRNCDEQPTVVPSTPIPAPSRVSVIDWSKFACPPK